jgi:hypothetical protein
LSNTITGPTYRRRYQEARRILKDNDADYQNLSPENRIRLHPRGSGEIRRLFEEELERRLAEEN